MNEENFSPSQPVLEPEKNNAKLVIVIAIIVAIVAITAGVIGFLLAKKTQAPATEPAVAQPAAQTSEAKTASDVQKPVVQPAETTQSADETTGWKTYTNNRVNYQFEYPASGLTLAIDETIKYPSTKAGDSKTEDLVQFATDKTSYSIQTEIGINHDSIESWIKDTNVSNADGNISLYTKTFIGGKVAYTSKAGLVTYVYNNGNIYSIIARSGIAPSNDKNDSIYSHLLSTFKFTNTVTDETADWKTYVNDSYGLSFKYPKTYTMDPVSNLKAGTIRTLKLFDTARPGNPTIEFVVPDGRGPFGPADILYDTEIEKGKIVIKNRKVIPYLGEGDTHTKDDKTYIEFEIGHLYGPSGNMYDSKYSATSGNGILVWFSYVKSEDYEQELKDIISSITITKPEIYGKK